MGPSVVEVTISSDEEVSSLDEVVFSTVVDSSEDSSELVLVDVAKVVDSADVVSDGIGRSHERPESSPSRFLTHVHTQAGSGTAH
jgi:hypothetical protein